MNRDIFTVGEKDSVEIVLNIMKWKNINHVPVIDNNKKLIGLLTREVIEDNLCEDENMICSVKGIMIPDKEIITIGQNQSLIEAKEVMKKNSINGIPVVQDKKLIGIITSNDIIE